MQRAQAILIYVSRACCLFSAASVIKPHECLLSVLTQLCYNHTLCLKNSHPPSPCHKNGYSKYYGKRSKFPFYKSLPLNKKYLKIQLSCYYKQVVYRRCSGILVKFNFAELTFGHFQEN